MNDSVEGVQRNVARKTWGTRMPHLLTFEANQIAKECREQRSIVIYGLGGTGTSSLLRNMVERFPSLAPFKTGDNFRQMAVDMFPELAKLGVEKARAELERQALIKGSGIDIKIDVNAQYHFCTNQFTIFDSRLAAFSLQQVSVDPRSDLFLVYLTCDDAIRFERTAKRDGVSVAESEKSNRIREAQIDERYSALYGVPLGDLVNSRYYDLVIDTGIWGEQCTADLVCEHAEWLHHMAELSVM